MPYDFDPTLLNEESPPEELWQEVCRLRVAWQIAHAHVPRKIREDIREHVGPLMGVPVEDDTQTRH